MTIKEVSEKYAITQDTLRYYERIGLLPPVPRTKSGIRNYDEVSIRWIEFIKCMRQAGMSIEKLLEYMNLFQQGRKTVTLRKELLQEQKKELEQTKEELNATIDKLTYKIKLYEEIEQGKRKDFMEEEYNKLG